MDEGYAKIGTLLCPYRRFQLREQRKEPYVGPVQINEVFGAARLALLRSSGSAIRSSPRA